MVSMGMISSCLADGACCAKQPVHVRQRTAITVQSAFVKGKIIRQPEIAMRTLPLFLGATLALSAVSAQAQDVIGNSVSVVPAAFSEIEGNKDPLSVGADVMRDAFVRTDKGGSTTLRFKDESELKIGERSRVKLDRFVFDDEKTFSNAGVMMIKGSFRWATGHSPKPSYDLRTPTATIGIRGTILEIRVTADVTLITVIEGAIRACTLDSSACINADPKTGTVRVTRDRAEIDTGKRQRRADATPKDTPPVVKTNLRKSEPSQPEIRKTRIRKAEATPTKPKRVKIVTAKPAEKLKPKRVKQVKPKRTRVIVDEYFDDGDVIIVERPRRRPVIEPEFGIQLGLELLGQVQRSRKPRLPDYDPPSKDRGSYDPQ
jgi:hypothetical protein